MNIIAMIAVMVVIMLGVLKRLDIHTRHDGSVVVPDVKGMTVGEATEIFRNHGLVYVISGTEYVKGKAASIILELKPRTGERVKEGRTIYLTVNTLDVPLHAIPNMADNNSSRQTQAKLLNAGFRLNQVQLVSDEKGRVRDVRRQGRQLATGEKAPLGASLILMVGDGSDDMSEGEDPVDVPVDTEKSVTSESSLAQDDSWF